MYPPSRSSAAEGTTPLPVLGRKRVQDFFPIETALRPVPGFPSAGATTAS
eukprot:CAMPEP_0206389514 /NCGR_PEP_ID=MMETSP0294-20121207/17985_1 /ASSEMBLY_ACC=CAM_ASM_000327 /TAXON_ID=39354 /ORGANISM="Heterosigma akashiwo, Strain CCMP2393" /LENGTH=49 /DNA_ID= /DNA_START= /DNA_END= /DNA_ORIENTATION=